MSEWANKWFREGEISKEWRNYIINEDAQPGKSSRLYKTQKQGNPVRLLTTGYTIVNLSKFIEKVCETLTENMRYRNRDISHLLDFIDTINEEGMPDEII